MGTGTVALANFVLILQVVTGDHSATTGGSNINKWQELGNDLKDAVDKKIYFPKETKPIPLGGSNYKNLDDVYESQIPLPPIWNDTPEINAGSPTDRNTFSGAGHLETNEIIKNINYLPKKDLLSVVKNKNLETPKEAPELEPYNFPVLDKAVERAINNLPSSEESPLVPLIKAFNKRVNERIPDQEENPKKFAEKKFLQKQIILKLANKVQKQREDDIRRQSQITEDSPVQSNNEESEDSQPCGCEDGCGQETPEDQSEKEAESNQVNQLADENINANKGNKKLLAHIFILIRRPRPNEESNTQVRPIMSLPPSREEPVQYFRPRKYPSLAHVVLRATSSRSFSTNNIPTTPFDDNEVNLSHEPLMTGILGCDDKEDENEHDLGRNKAAFPFMESSRQQIPKEFLFLRFVNNLMKEKAAANAFRDNTQKRTLPQIFPLPTFQNSPKDSVQTIPRLMLLKPNSQRLQPQLPPLHFPDENSGYIIKHGSLSRIQPKFDRSVQESSDNEDESRISLQRFNNIRSEDSDEFPQGRTEIPQDIPLFIRNMIAHLSRNALEDRLQPIPAPSNGNPIMLRALLAPYAH